MCNAAAVAALAGLAACGSLGLPPVGSGISYAPDGTALRTFAFSAARVKTATLGAFGRMGIRHVGTQKTPEGEVLRGIATGRDVEFALEPLSPGSTRVRVAVRNGHSRRDSSAAGDIILQTERLLGDT